MKIKVSDTTKLSEAIKTAEGRATARTITPEAIAEELRDVERTLGISKKALKGVSVVCDPNAQHFASAYKYTPVSTIFEAAFTSEWFVTAIYRGASWNRDNAHKVKLTDDAERAILERMTDF